MKTLLTAALAANFALLSGSAFASAGPQPVPQKYHIPAPRDVAYPGMLEIHVDATDLAHRIYRVHEIIPVKPGPVTLLYPQWIPGAHEPSGPIDKFAGLVVHANGKRLDWIRDPVQVYGFHVDVPAGVSKLDVDFKFLTPQNKRQGRVTMSPEMLRLDWNTVALYPAGYYTRDIDTQASVTLPKDFKFATALEVDHRNGDTVTFKPIDFENLVDSPMLAGKYYKRINLTPAGSDAPVHLDVFADEPRDLKVTPEQIKAHRNLVEQMYKLYGAHHYDHYDFLFSLSDKLGGMGLEHHRSSEDGVKPGYFTKWKEQWTVRDLLAHEYNHSWDGKYRRPAALWTPNYNVPMRDHGLWVYEGYTQYNGFVMAARAGLWSKKQALERLAGVAARYDRGRPGMKWRTIWDTTNDPTIAERAPLPYRNYQMSEDYYSGGQLVWLAVDAKIRSLTNDKRSLDDFARAFFGVHNGAWDINTYTFDDVVDTLNSIARYDWKTFLSERLGGHGNLSEAFEAQGWKLVYTDKPNAATKAYEKRDHSIELTYSLGISVDKDGTMRDVLWDSPAFKAGLAPAMVIKAVNGKAFTTDGLKQAVVAARTDKAPIKLLVTDFNEYKTISIDYHGGLKYPHLERIPGKPDYLSQVLAARH
ncbi:MAG TPA: M61 family peptidase [Gammaproteobacteria bacterium]|nr:M61 family peptidase [Gammaproteobacteria bacterium]